MPLTPFGVAQKVTEGLFSVTIAGPAVTDIAKAVGIGVCKWTAALKVVTADTGTVGLGKGQLPCLIPPALLVGAFNQAFPSASLIGTASDNLATGIANGLAVAFAEQALIQTVHPAVGVGVAVASFPGPTAVPFMITAFGEAGVVGSSTEKLASAIGSALDAAFAGFTISIPIVGTPSPSAVTAIGGGQIV